MAYNIGEAIGYIKLNIKDYLEKADKVTVQAASLDKIADGMGSTFDKAGKMAAAAFAAVTAAAGAALKTVVSVGASFEASMSQVAATMGMTASAVAGGSSDFEALSKAAKDMGAQTMFSASQAAQALNYLALAGYSVEESISTLPSVLNAAAAGGMDLGAASDMITDAMSALGLSVDEAASFVDKMAKTSQRSNTNIAQLGAGILQIGGTAKSLSGGVNELNTALGILANNGIKAAEGGTALRQIVLNLTAPSEKAAKYMESIGFSAYDAAGNMKPLNQTFAELDQIMSQFTTQKDKDNVLTSIFDARQLKSARALLANYGDSWDNLYEQIDNADGAASRMADTMQHNLTGALTIAKSALEAVQVTAYDGLQKGLTEAVQTATTSFNRLNQALSTPKAQQALANLADIIGKLVNSLIEFAADSLIPKIINMLNNLSNISSTVKSIFAASIPIIIGVTAGVIKYNTALVKLIALKKAEKIATIAANAAALVNPYTAVAVAIGVVVGATIKYVESLKSVIKEAQNQETEFSKMADTANELANAYEEAKYHAEETAGANIEQINQIRTLTNQLGEYANITHMSAEELANAEAIISELNELYPENTALIQDGQVVAYDELARAVQNYTDQLYYADQMEAAKERKAAALEAKTTAEENIKGQAEAVIELSEAYQKAEQDYNYYMQGHNNYYDWQKEEAKQMGMSLKEYFAYKKELALADYENAAAAWSKNKRLLGEATEEYEQAEADIAETQNKINQITSDMAEPVNPYQEDAESNLQKTKENFNKMWEEIDKLDKKWKLGIIKSEEDYQNRRMEILMSSPARYNEEWYEEYNKYIDYQAKKQEEADKKAEERRQQSEKDQEEANKEYLAQQETFIEEQWESIRKRHEMNENYTIEMMLADMRNALDFLDKNTEVYEDYHQKMLDEEYDFAKKQKSAIRETAEDNFNAWTDKYNQIVEKTKKDYEEIAKERENLTNSLINSVELYSTKTTQVWNKEKQQWEDIEKKEINTQGIKDRTKEIENYSKTLDKLGNKGVSENVLTKMFEMDTTEAMNFANNISKMSQTEIEELNKAYEDLTKASGNLSQKVYDKKFEMITNSYNQQLEKWKGEVPNDWQLVGQETIDGFISGIEGKKEESETALNDIFSGGVKSIKELLGIHSSSTVFEEIGENVVQGMINGISGLKKSLLETFKTLGSNSEAEFTAGFKSIFDDFLSNTGYLNTIAIGNSIAQSMYTPQSNIPYNPQPGSVTTIAADTSSGMKLTNALTRNDVVSAIKEAMPSGDVVMHISETEFARVSRKALNTAALNGGQMGLKI